MDYRYSGNVLTVTGEGFRTADKRALRKLIEAETGLKLAGSLTIVKDTRLMVCTASESDDMARAKYGRTGMSAEYLARLVGQAK